MAMELKEERVGLDIGGGETTPRGVQNLLFRVSHIHKLAHRRL